MKNYRDAVETWRGAADGALNMKYIRQFRKLFSSLSYCIGWKISILCVCNYCYCISCGCSWVNSEQKVSHVFNVQLRFEWWNLHHSAGLMSHSHTSVWRLMSHHITHTNLQNQALHSGAVTPACVCEQKESSRVCSQSSTFFKLPALFFWQSLERLMESGHYEKAPRRATAAQSNFKNWETFN